MASGSPALAASGVRGFQLPRCAQAARLGLRAPVPLGTPAPQPPPLQAYSPSAPPSLSPKTVVIEALRPWGSHHGVVGR